MCDICKEEMRKVLIDQAVYGQSVISNEEGHLKHIPLREYLTTVSSVAPVLNDPPPHTDFGIEGVETVLYEEYIPTVEEMIEAKMMYKDPTEVINVVPVLNDPPRDKREIVTIIVGGHKGKKGILEDKTVNRSTGEIWCQIRVEGRRLGYRQWEIEYDN